MIIIRRVAGLGGQLFQYTFGRTLAHRWKYRLERFPISGYPQTFSANAGTEIITPLAKWTGNWPLDLYTGRRIAKEELLYAPENCLEIWGEFLRWEHIADFREEIRFDWLKSNTSPLIPRRGMVLCVRCEEESLTECQVRTIVKISSCSEPHFVSDVPNDPLMVTLRDLRGTWSTGKGIEMLRFIQSFECIAFCQSVLYWWASFLSEAWEIYFPAIDAGNWSHPSPAKFAYDPPHYGIDLRVLDENRYIYNWWSSDFSA